MIYTTTVFCKLKKRDIHGLKDFTEIPVTGGSSVGPLSEGVDCVGEPVMMSGVHSKIFLLR